MKSAMAIGQHTQLQWQMGADLYGIIDVSRTGKEKTYFDVFETRKHAFNDNKTLFGDIRNARYAWLQVSRPISKRERKAVIANCRYLDLCHVFQKMLQN